MEKLEYKCTPSLHKKIIESTKDWLDKEEIRYQEFSPTTQGIVIQTEKNKLIVNIGFEPPFIATKPGFPNEQVCNNEAIILIVNGELWETRNIRGSEVFGMLYPISRTPSKEEKNHLNKMKINIFKIIENMTKIEK